mmetsp:Transcript_19477/g.34731  ORF Transcript_19477/g.34731 Transcript_19477/m.34731 type:complete len:221 (-) Transcript_19477:1013-1675(-)
MRRRRNTKGHQWRPLREQLAKRIHCLCQALRVQSELPRHNWRRHRWWQRRWQDSWNRQFLKLLSFAFALALALFRQRLQSIRSWRQSGRWWWQHTCRWWWWHVGNSFFWAAGHCGHAFHSSHIWWSLVTFLVSFLPTLIWPAFVAFLTLWHSFVERPFWSTFVCHEFVAFLETLVQFPRAFLSFLAEALPHSFVALFATKLTSKFTALLATEVPRSFVTF